jgi:hypothetical protein
MAGSRRRRRSCRSRRRSSRSPRRRASEPASGTRSRCAQTDRRVLRAPYAPLLTG